MDCHGGVHSGFTPVRLSKISAMCPPSRNTVTRSASFSIAAARRPRYVVGNMAGPIVHWWTGCIARGESMRKSSWLLLLLALPVVGLAQPPAGAQQAFQKVCGACHSLETVTSQRRTRPQWQESITSMIARGAKGTEEEFSLILDYLTVTYGPTSPGGRGATPAAPTQAGRGRGPGPAFSPGPADKQVIDTAAADRGRRVYA